MTNTKKICAITGSNGYVGGCIKNYFTAHGWEVLELTRQPKPATNAVKFQLGNEIPSSSLAGVNTLIHCAYDFKPLRWEEIRAVNIEGSHKLFRAARTANVEKIIFISTISAFDGCRSLYGKAKLEIEKIALAHGALVVRPGLVYGDGPGGMFGKLAAQVRQSSMIPLIGDGSQIQYLVHHEDLAGVIYTGAEGKFTYPNRPVTIAHEQPWPFRELLKKIARQQNKSIRFIPLPWRLVWAGIKGAELCHVPLNFRSDSLISLMYQNPKPDFSAIVSAGLVCRPFTAERL